MHTYIHIYMYTCSCRPGIYTQICIQIYTCIYICIYIWGYCVSICTHTYNAAAVFTLLRLFQTSSLQIDAQIGSLSGTRTYFSATPLFSTPLYSTIRYDTILSYPFVNYAKCTMLAAKPMIKAGERNVSSRKPCECRCCFFIIRAIHMPKYLPGMF